MSLRPVEAPRPASFAGTEVGACPAELRMLPIAALVIDDRYQRPLERSGWSKIRRIAEAFRWEHFTPCLVTAAGEGRFAVIDGQHRIHGAAMAGAGQVPCMVVDVDPPAAARAFAAVNGDITRVTPFHLYRSALAAGETWALDARDSVAAAGCALMDVARPPNARRAREVYCIKTVAAHVAAGRGEVVTRGLSAIVAGSGTALSRFEFEHRILRPWWAVLATRSDLSLRQLTGFCEGESLADLNDAVSALLTEPRYHRQTRHGLMVLSIRAKLNERFGRVAA